MAFTAISFVIVAVAAITFFWTSFQDRYGPSTQHESQCLICQRMRIEKWVCGEKVMDSIRTNEYSDWIDSFEPKEHEHAWLVASSSYRLGWFGRTGIACGGVNVLSTIYSQRAVLGEDKARRVASAFHRVVRSPGFESGQLKRMDNFLENLSGDLDFWLEHNE